MHQYGIDINTLEKFITKPQAEEKDWGRFCVAVDLPEYRLEQYEISAGKSCELQTARGHEVTIFVESGVVRVDDIELTAQELVSSEGRLVIMAKEDSIVYAFHGPAEYGSVYHQKSKTSDFRDKYWGSIETIVSRDYAAKRLVVRKERHASFEYHCRKLESYFIHSGKLLLRNRAGRGEDRYFELEKGTATITPPGLMHQRGGLEDTVIIEISTRDEDGDSYLVEDGAKLPMPRLRQGYGGLDRGSEEYKGRRICFDIDGVLRTQTDGDYENAQPIKEAIDFINKLYNEGFWITLYTSSFMGRAKNDQKAAYEAGFAFNKKQLAGWGVKYHELFMGKPPTDLLIDDRALFYNQDWAVIEKEIRSKLQ